jgi:hypothetical protein
MFVPDLAFLGDAYLVTLGGRGAQLSRGVHTRWAIALCHEIKGLRRLRQVVDKVRGGVQVHRVKQL